MANNDRFTVRASEEEMQKFAELKEAFGFTSSSPCGAMLINIGSMLYRLRVLVPGDAAETFSIDFSRTTAGSTKPLDDKRPLTATSSSSRENDYLEPLVQQSAAQIDKSVCTFAGLTAVLMQTVGNLKQDEIDEIMQSLFPDKLPETVKNVKHHRHSKRGLLRLFGRR